MKWWATWAPPRDVPLVFYHIANRSSSSKGRLTNKIQEQHASTWVKSEPLGGPPASSPTKGGWDRSRVIMGALGKGTGKPHHPGGSGGRGKGLDEIASAWWRGHGPHWGNSSGGVRLSRCHPSSSGWSPRQASHSSSEEQALSRGRYSQLSRRTDDLDVGHVLVCKHPAHTAALTLEGNCESEKSLSRVQLCFPMDSTVHGLLQARILEWVAFPFSRASSQPRDGTQVSVTVGGFFTSWTTRGAQEYWSGVAYPFSRGSSQLRSQIGVSCIASRFFTSWAMREAHDLRDTPMFWWYSEYHHTRMIRA